MKTLGALLIAGAAVMFVAPASAQSVTVGVGDVGVRVGTDRDHYRDRRWRDRDRYREVSRCRVIKERTVTPSGRVIVETRRICG